MKKMKFRKVEYNVAGIAHTLIGRGTYKHYEYVMWNHMAVPTAYVKIPSHHPYHKCPRELIEWELVIHGGIKYIGRPFWNETDSNDYWIGWNYAHAGDYIGIVETLQNGKKWTTKQIYKEVKSVIKQLIKLKKNGYFAAVDSAVWTNGGESNETKNSVASFRDSSEKN